ncbi:MAG: DUF2889 domain-containing protein [Methylocystaceae bacterium]
MPNVYNSTISLQVTRTSDNELLAETTLLSTDTEAVGWIVTDIKELKIKDCHYALYRTGQGNTRIFSVPELQGAEAYFNAGSVLKQALGTEAGREIPRELISECIRGAIQAESFFFTERGYADAAAYDAYWDKMYKDSCRLYSHLDRMDQPWMEYIGYTRRDYNLFNRIKSVVVYHEDYHDLIQANFIDSFHELGLKLRLDHDSLVIEAQGNFVRAPQEICYENSGHLKGFIGLNLAAMSKRDIAALAGGSEGCNHLVDLLYEAAKAAARIAR